MLATGIPQKGRVLTQLSLFWFDFLKDIVPNHLVTADVRQYPAELQQYADQLRGRSMLVVRADMINDRVRGARLSFRFGLEGIQGNGSVCGIPLPGGLRESDKLPEPIFTPAIKASQRSRREHLVRPHGEDRRPRAERATARAEHQDLPDRGAITRRRAASSSPIPSLSSARRRADWCWPTRC